MALVSSALILKNPLMVLGLVALTFGCSNGDETGPKKSSPKQPAIGQSGDAFPGDRDLSIALTDFSQSLDFPASTPLELRFTLSGASGKDIIVALSKLPRGAVLRNANSANPILAWANPTPGNHSVQFILRDRERCTNPSSCAIPATQFGQIAGKSIDVISQTWTLRVGRNGNGFGTGGNTGLGGLNGGLGRANPLVTGILSQVLGGGLPGTTGGVGGLGGGANLGQILGQFGVNPQQFVQMGTQQQQGLLQQQGVDPNLVALIMGLVTKQQ